MCSGRPSGEPMTRPSYIALHRAFDEARFGPRNTLDLRSSLPTAAQAVRRAEAWLRERQMAKAGEVLVVTGRGKGSPGGVAVVREAVRRLLVTLKRKGVVSASGDHTPGSFVVTLAPVRALFETMQRSRVPTPRVPPAEPAELGALAEETRAGLRRLAERSLEILGAPRSDRFVRDEMRRQFAVLSSAVGADQSDREGRLLLLIAAAQDSFDETE
jgi:hypothetical protein